MKLKADINLDDEQECAQFRKDIEAASLKAAKVVKMFGWEGQAGAFDAARTLIRYADNRTLAFSARRRGDIPLAQTYEEVCEVMYRTEIAPRVECW